MEKAAYSVRNGITSHTEVPSSVANNEAAEDSEHDVGNDVSSLFEQSDEEAFMNTLMASAKVSEYEDEDESDAFDMENAFRKNEESEEEEERSVFRESDIFTEKPLVEEVESKSEGDDERVFMDRQCYIMNKNIEYQLDNQKLYALGNKRKRKQSKKEKACKDHMKLLRKRARAKRTHNSSSSSSSSSPSSNSDTSSTENSRLSANDDGELNIQEEGNASPIEEEPQQMDVESDDDNQVLAAPNLDFNWYVEKNTEESPAIQRMRFKPVLPRFAVQIGMLREHWEPEDAKTPLCWGCKNQDTISDSVYAGLWIKMLGVFFEGLNRLYKPVELANTLYEMFYKSVLQYADKAIDEKNAELPDAEYRKNVGKKPVWTKYGMMRHLLYHTSDPKVLVAKEVWRTIEILEILHENCTYVQHNKSGRIAIDFRVLREIERQQNILFKLLRLDVTKFPTAVGNRNFEAHAGTFLPKSRRVVQQTTHTHLYKKGL